MTREQVRAVALAAIMVVSMVAVGAGFVGSAVAQNDGSTTYEVGQGNGTNFQTIQEALSSDALSPGDTLELVDETYSPSGQLTVDTAGVEIVGVGDTTIESESTGYGIRVTAVDVRLSNFEITGSGTYAVKVSGADLSEGRLDGFTIENVEVRDSGSTGIDLNAVTNATIDSVTVSDTVSGNGIAFTDVTDTEVTGVTTTNNSWGGVAIYADGALSDQLGDDVGSYGIEFDGDLNADEPLPLYEQASSDDLIGDIDYPGNIQYRVAANTSSTPPDRNVANQFEWFYTSESAAVDAAVATNDGTGTDAAVVSELGGPFVVADDMSVQSAVNGAAAGDTIVVRQGMYLENVTIDTADLSIEGPNAGIPGDHSDRTSEAVIQGQVVASADGVVFDGLTVTPPNASTDAGAEALRVSGAADNITVRNNVVRDFGAAGLPEWEGVDAINVFGGNADDAVRNVIVADNLIENVSGRSTKGGVTGISVQGNVENADVSDNVVRNVGESDTAWAFGAVVRGTGNHDVVPSEISIAQNNISNIRSNPETRTVGVGIGVEAGGAPAVTFENNSVSDAAFLVEDKTATINLSVFAGNNDLDRGAILQPVEIDGQDRNIVLNSVQDALNLVSENETVKLVPGIYAENVSVETPNVTLVGQGDDTVIDGSVALDADETTLSEVRINASVGDVFPNPAAENNAVNVAGSNVTVSDVTVDLSVESAEFSEGLAIEVFGSDASATITNATIDGTGEMTADNLTAVVGVSADAGADATVRDSDIDVASDGYSFAVVARGGATTDVRNNELSASGGELDGVGFGVEGDNPGAQTVRFNTFDGVETIENKAGDGELDVTGNYWTDLSDVEFLTDADTFKEAQKGGEITYDPLLTVEPDEVDADSLGETTQFGHDLVIPADGDTHSVAFPAATEGTVDEVFGDFNGTVYAYNGTNWVGNEDIADQRISALDAFAVTIDEDESDQRITFEYADADSEIPEMTSTELEAGWNFVAAPSNGTVSNAFGVSTTEVASVVNVVGGPADKSTPYRLAGSDEINPTTVGPFQGYWVFATDDGELGAAVPVGPTQSDEETTLKGN
ncbi:MULTISPECIES: right-handed parallel beta-helix repeat-containing protein [Halorubrum]|uniref:Right handed beta helix domain-containing protein n=1 Tax=Halorubrum tropicale TaxID=1765655 RepID=A0A0M9AP13_9EURY|nr:MULTISPECIES: right-handed parallel beta-helix repeat-containing protein [Halorubrum]KOX95852.1 hypothetical protein AMR74_13030 [Halorubrum tropicale]TKX44589.1 hypothetical protein EXE50_05905 [Halorubrum sp. ARQ200]